MSKVAILVRHLEPLRPVAMAIIKEPKNINMIGEELDLYFEMQLSPIINKIKEEFIEFNRANFYIDILEISED
jgi:hypothetical protein